MNKKIIFASIFVIGMLALAMGYGTYSYFSSTKTSTGNIFTAGTLNLQLSNDNASWYDGVTATWASPSGWAPGDNVTSSIYLRNTGSIPAEAVYACWSNLTDPNGLSNVIEVTWLSDSTWIGENSIGPFVAAYDANNDTKLSLAELVYGLSHFNSAKTPDPNQARFYADFDENYTHPVLTANAGNVFEIKMTYQFMKTAGNEYQGRSASFDLTLAAWQHHYEP
jgi:predicted ribosomally synthesized peptide with SipW-like signal peptide